MEGLIILLGGLMGGVFVLAIPVFSAILALVADLIVTVVMLLIRGFQRSSSTESGRGATESGPAAAPIAWGKWLKWGGLVSGGIVVFYVVVVGTLQLFFFKPAASALLQRFGEKAGIGLEFTDVRGNLFTGKFAIDGLTLESETGKNSWKAEVGTAAIDIDMLRILGKRSWLDSLTIEDVTAEVNANAAPEFDPLATLKRLKQPPEPEKRYREKRRFGIRETRLENLQLTWNRPGSTQTLAIEHFDCENLKSEYAVFQVFFRSNAHGRLNETPWKIVTEKTGPLARRTEWRFEGVPLGLAADTIGGPFKLFENGTLDVFVTDEWSLGNEGAGIDLDWQFLFHGFEAKPPAKLADSTLVAAVVGFINKAADPLDIHFTLILNEDEVKGRASLDTRVLADTLTQALLPKNADAVKNKAKELWNKFREKKEDG